MADLDLALFQGTLPRRQPRRVGGVPSLRGAEFVPEGGEATSALGGAIARIGQDLSAIDLRFAQAKADTLGAEALSELAVRMQTRAQEIRSDPTIFPTDRAGAFSEEFEGELNRIQQTIPALGQDSFRRQSTTMFLRMQRDLASNGRKEAVARAGVAYAQQLALAQDGLVAAQNPVERAEVLETLTETTNTYIRDGLLTPEEGAQRVREVQQGAAVTTAQLAIAQTPQRALDQLKQGPQANPFIPTDKLPQLIEAAQAAVDNQVIRQSRLDSIAEKELGKQQDALASRYRMQATRLDITAEELQTLQRSINQDRSEGDLNEADHTDLTDRIQAQLSAVLTGTRPVDQFRDKALRDTYFIQLQTAENREQIEMTKELIIGDAGAMQSGSVTALLNEVDQRRSAVFFGNRDSYREAVRILRERANPVGMQAVILEKLDPKIKARMAQSLSILRNRMETLSPEQVDEQAMEVATLIADQYFPVAKDYATAQRLLPDSLQNMSYPDAVRALERQKLPPLMGRELLRLLKWMNKNGWMIKPTGPPSGTTTNR